MSNQDVQGFEAIITNLEDTGALAAVVFGAEADANVMVNRGHLPLALVTPGPWREVEHNDPTAATRHVAFTITLMVQGPSALERYREASRLVEIVQENLEGSDLNGASLPGLTRIRQGGPESNLSAPELRYKLQGTFGYIIPDITQRTGAP